MKFQPVIKFLTSTDFKKPQTLTYFSRLSIDKGNFLNYTTRTGFYF